MPDYVTLDRLESGIAILVTDTRAPVRLPCAALPPGAREGDVLRRDGDVYTVDVQETARRKEKNARLFAALKKPPESPDTASEFEND